MYKAGRSVAVCAALLWGACASAGSLPADYQEVSCVDSTGVEWIDTGVVINENHELQFKVAVLTLSGYKGPFDSYSDSTSNFTRITPNNGDKKNWLVNFMSKSSTTFAAVTTAAGNAVEGYVNIGHAKLNTVEMDLTRTVGDDETSTLKLFGRSGSATATRIYYFRILEGGEVKHNYVPCYKRDASGEVGLYDTVEGEFLGNDSGAGALVAGGTVDYIWTGAAGDGKWMTGGNWSVGGETAVCPPRQASDIAVFLADTTAEVCFDASISFNTLNVTNKNLRLTFTQVEGVSVTCKTLNAGEGSVSARHDSDMVFDGVNLTVSGSTAVRPNPGKNFRLTGGTQLSVYDAKWCVTVDKDKTYYVGNLVVEDGSSLTVRRELKLSGRATLSISNATVSAATVYFNGGYQNGGDSGGGGRIQFFGESPKLCVSSQISDANDGYTGGLGADVEFFVPVGGYAEAPIQYTGSTTFAIKPTSSTHVKTPIRFSVRGDSPIVDSADTGAWPLVSCTGTGAIESTYVSMSTAASTVTEALELTDETKTMLYTRAAPASCLVVTGVPLEFGTGDYGAQRGLAQGATQTLTAPTSDSENLTCTGYKIYDVAADGKRTFVSGGTETSFEYTHGTTRREVVWQWSRPDVYVSNANGDDVNNDGLSWDSPLKTIQAGIDKFDYAVVHVAPDTYLTSATTAIAEGKGVEVRGEGTDAAGVVLKLTSGTVRVLDIAGEHSVVTNLTVTNGDTDLLGGVNMTAGLLAGCIVAHCSVANNKSDGGGIYMTGGTVLDCVISNNTAKCSGGNAKRGGGIFMTGGLVENCRILNNTASSGSAASGGGVYMTGGTLRGCLFRGNSAKYSSFALGATYGTIENNTFVANNNSSSSGKAVVLDRWSKFRNNIVHGNTGASGALANVSADSACTLEYNCTDPLLTSGIGNSDDPPVFEDADAGDYRLQFCPLVNGAMLRPWMDAVFDLAGTPRVVGPRPDIGCYERPPSTGLLCTFSAESSGALDLANVTLTSTVEGDTTGIVYYWRVIRADGAVLTRSGAEEANPTFALGTGDYDIELAVTNRANRGAFTRVEGAAKIRASVVYVNEAGSDAYPYATKENGAHDFTQAFELLAPGGTVYVANGVYDITARILLGGAFGTKVISLNGPDNCVIRAKGSRFASTALRMFEMTGADSRLEGLTIAGGRKGLYNAGDSFTTYGTILISTSSAVVTNCVVRDVVGVDRGPAGAGINMSKGKVVDSVIVNVTEGMSGGSPVTGTALTMSGGTADRVVITNCQSTGTTAIDAPGSVVSITGGTLRNSLIADCDGSHSAPVYIGSGVTAENCSVVGNVNSEMNAKTGDFTYNHCGGAVVASGATVVNTIFADNISMFAGNVESNLYCSVNVPFDHCLIADRAEQAGEGNVFKHPKFNRKAGDWRLRNSSPGVDQGKVLDWMDEATDLKGTPRIQGAAPDIGCHEDFVHGLMLMVR